VPLPSPFPYTTLFRSRSLSLYTRLGFDIRESISCMQGRTSQRSVPGCAVRAAQTADLPACNALSRQVHGFDRGRELAEAVHEGRSEEHTSELQSLRHL